MSIPVFNASLLIGWLLVLAGGTLINLGIGLLIAGILLIVLALLIGRLFGVFAQQEDD